MIVTLTEPVGTTVGIVEKALRQTLVFAHVAVTSPQVVPLLLAKLYPALALALVLFPAIGRSMGMGKL